MMPTEIDSEQDAELVLRKRMAPRHGRWRKPTNFELGAHGILNDEYIKSIGIIPNTLLKRLEPTSPLHTF